MNILKYLIAETINDENGEEMIDLSQSKDQGNKSITDSVFQAFSALSNNSDEVNRCEQHQPKSILANSDIILNDGIFTHGGLMAHLDTVH